MEELALLAGETLLAVRRRASARALAEANDKSRHFGKDLRAEEQRALLRHAEQAVADAGRLEVGEGVLPQLVLAFCNSPYIPPAAFANVLAELTECFYHFKNEAGERLGDEELIDCMKRQFDGPCAGSIEYLANTFLEAYARDARAGTPPKGLEAEGD